MNKEGNLWLIGHGNNRDSMSQYIGESASLQKRWDLEELGYPPFTTMEAIKSSIAEVETPFIKTLKGKTIPQPGYTIPSLKKK